MLLSSSSLALPGILTHIKLKVHRKEDHLDARGLRYFLPYNKDALQKLLKIKADMARDVDLPADYDFCVTVISNGVERLQSLTGALGNKQGSKEAKAAGGAMPAKAAFDAADNFDESKADAGSALKNWGLSDEEIQEFKEVSEQLRAEPSWGTDWGLGIALLGIQKWVNTDFTICHSKSCHRPRTSSRHKKQRSATKCGLSWHASMTTYWPFGVLLVHT